MRLSPLVEAAVQGVTCVVGGLLQVMVVLVVSIIAQQMVQPYRQRRDNLLEFFGLFQVTRASSYYPHHALLDALYPLPTQLHMLTHVSCLSELWQRLLVW